MAIDFGIPNSQGSRAPAQREKATRADPLFYATAGIAILLVALFLALSFFGKPAAIFPEAAWLIPVIHSFLVLATISIAFLSLGRYQVLRDPASYWVGMGFVVYGVGFLFYTLCFPGLLPNGGSLLANLPRTAAWIVESTVSVHGMLLLAAVLSRWPCNQALAGRSWLWTLAACVGLVSLMCVLFIAREEHLPPLVTPSGVFTPLLFAWQWELLLVYGAGALLSLRHYLACKDVLLGYVAIAQVAYTFAEIALQVGGRRYDLWWFLTRTIIAAGSITLMFGLLGGYVRLYTERKLAEETLRESEARFRSMYVNAAVGIQQLANDGRLLMVNEAFCRMLGYSESELLGRDVLDLTHPDDLARNLVVRGPAVRGERDWYEIEKRYIHRDGSPVWVHITSSVVKDVSGHTLYRVAIVQDVTDRKRAEETLRESEKRFGMLASATFEGIVITEGGRIADLNEQLAKMLGYERQEMIGKQISTFLLAEERDLVLANIRNGIEIRVEHRMLCKDGRQITVEAHGQTARYRDRTLRFTAIRDITERKRAEAALIQSEKLASVGRMASSIAHEINNPLETIGHAVYLAVTDPGTSPQAKSYLDLATQELERVTHITKQTLAFHREKRTPSLIDLRESIDGALRLFAPRLNARGISVEKRYVEVDRVTASRGEVHQVISNLLSNSMDAVPNNGKIYLCLARSIGKNGSAGVRFTIADTGSGIASERLKKIFEPFFTTKEVVGTGLGLWVTKQIVDSHRATIQVRSKVGKGTVFSITFPLTEQPIDPAPKATL